MKFEELRERITPLLPIRGEEDGFRAGDLYDANGSYLGKIYGSTTFAYLTLCANMMPRMVKVLKESCDLMEQHFNTDKLLLYKKGCDLLNELEGVE